MVWRSEWRYLLATCIFAVIMNILAVVVVLRTRATRRTFATALLISLLASDVLNAAVVVPVRIVEIWLSKNAVFSYIYAYVLFVSVFNTIFLSVDRYASSAKPLQSRSISTGVFFKLLALAWLGPFLFVILPLPVSRTSSYESFAIIYRYILVVLLCAIIMTIVVLEILVLRVLINYWSRLTRNISLRGCATEETRKDNFKNKLRCSLLCSCIILSTIVTWLPTIVFNFLNAQILEKISLFAFLMNSIVDPILIISFNSSAAFAGLCTRLEGQGTNVNRHAEDAV